MREHIIHYVGRLLSESPDIGPDCIVSYKVRYYVHEETKAHYPNYYWSTVDSYIYFWRMMNAQTKDQLADLEYRMDLQAEQMAEFLQYKEIVEQVTEQLTLEEVHAAIAAYIEKKEFEEFKRAKL